MREHELILTDATFCLYGLLELLSLSWKIPLNCNFTNHRCCKWLNGLDGRTIALNSYLIKFSIRAAYYSLVKSWIRMLKIKITLNYLDSIFTNKYADIMRLINHIEHKCIISIILNRSAKSIVYFQHSVHMDIYRRFYSSVSKNYFGGERLNDILFT